MNTMTLYKRPEAEKRINEALEKLRPDGEITGSMLARYTPWEDVKDIPLLEMGRVCAQLEKEPEFLAFLGEGKYFDTVTAGMKIALYRTALDRMEEALAVIGYKPQDGITFGKFRAVWNLCLKECRFPPASQKQRNLKNSRAISENFVEKRDQKISKNDISCPGQVISKNDKTNLKTVKEVISFLNKTSGRCFRTTSKATQKVIAARLHEGYTLEDFKKVIENRCEKWNHAPEYGQKDMRDYLRPETLFGGKFEGYLNAARGQRAEEDYLDQAEYIPLKERARSGRGPCGCPPTPAAREETRKEKREEALHGQKKADLYAGI